MVVPAGRSPSCAGVGATVRSSSHGRARGLTALGISAIFLKRLGGRLFARTDRQQLVDQRQHFRVRLPVMLRDRARGVAADKFVARGLDECSESRRDQAL